MTLAIRIFRSDRSCLLLLLVLGLLLFATGLGARDLWAPDEPDIGEVVREIHLSGSWAVLRDNQQLYFEKPPLYPWLAALFSLPAGRPTEFALRLPSSLAALPAGWPFSISPSVWPISPRGRTDCSSRSWRSWSSWRRRTISGSCGGWAWPGACRSRWSRSGSGRPSTAVAANRSPCRRSSSASRTGSRAASTTPSPSTTC